MSLNTTDVCVHPCRDVLDITLRAVHFNHFVCLVSWPLLFDHNIDVDYMLRLTCSGVYSGYHMYVTDMYIKRLLC